MSKHWMIALWIVLGASANAFAQPAKVKGVSEASGPVCNVDKPAAVVPGCNAACMARLTDTCSRNQVGAAGVPPEVTAISGEPALVEGAAAFVADRTKAEVIAWLEDLIGRRLCSLTYQPIADDGTPSTAVRWFDQTCKILQDPDYGAQISTAMIAAAVRSDVENLPVAIAFYQLDKLDNRTQVRILGDKRAAIEVLREWRDKTAPVAMIAGLGRNVALRDVCRHLAAVTPECVLVVTGLSVEFLAAATTPGAAAVPHAFDDIITKVFAGRKLACEIAVVFDPSQADPKATDNCAHPDKADLSKVPGAIKTYAELLNLADKDFQKYQPLVKELLKAISNLAAAVKSYNAKPTEDGLKTILDDIANVIRAGGNVLGQDTTVLQAFVGGAKELIVVYDDLSKKDYVLAGDDLITATSDFGIQLPPAVKKYLAFIIDLASAKSSDDVQAAIERVAAAVGGWKLKHEHMTLSVSAYAGVTAGYETPDTSTVSSSAMTKPTGGWAVGLFAPIGLDLSGPIFSGTFSHGLFLSIIDVGQPTWARLTNLQEKMDTSKAETTSNTSFAQVLSPGLYYHIGLGHSPFTVGFGASYAPALRKYTLTTAGGGVETDSLSTVRIGMFLSVDVTILPIWAHNGD